MSLAASTTDIVQVPADSAAMDGHVENMLCNTHGLYAGV